MGADVSGAPVCDDVDGAFEGPLLGREVFGGPDGRRGEIEGREKVGFLVGIAES